MKENMPDISFERSMNHNYMILSKCSFFGKDNSKSEDYRTRMLLENHIPGLLPVSHRLINGESRYYYEINSLQSLDRLYDKSEIQYEELRRLLSACVSLFDRLEEYLLDGTQIILKPELIYIDVEKMEPYFVCYPDYEGDVRMTFMELIDELLTKIDHTDERTVMLGYQIYRYTRNPNYVISEIGNMMEHVIVNMVQDTLYYRKKASNMEVFQHDKQNVEQNPQYKLEEKVNIEDQITNSSNFAAYTYDISEKSKEIPETKTIKRTIQMTEMKKKNVSDLIGGIFCVFVSFCSGMILLGAHTIPAFKLGGNNELYLYGAMVMAVVAAVLFFSCYLKKKRQDEGTEILEDDKEDETAQYYTAAENTNDTCGYYKDHPQNITASKPKVCNNTTYLGDRVVEERMLYGRMNGREINISLDKLPMTVGKLEKVSDFVIDDSAVSKMHARFEERDGRIYVCDLNSTNGTVRNGELLGVNQSVALEPGDKLRFGRTQFTYC